MDDNIQPDGSWRDPTAQMAMDIGLGKVNPNSAGYAAVELAHRTYGSDHINGLWGHHANAPAPAPCNDWWLNGASSAGYRPFPQPSASAAMPAPARYGVGTEREYWDTGAPVAEQDAPEININWKTVRDDCLGFAWTCFCCLVLAYFLP